MVKVKIDPRKKDRDRNNTLGDNIVRYIVELVTNSDDSYKKLDNQLIQHDGTILIKLEKERRNDSYILSVTDHAEGISTGQLFNIFSNYAGDNSGGAENDSRGVFGQGASDVLSSAAADERIAMIETIKDDVVSRLKYRIDEDRDGDIDVKEVPAQGNQLKQIRNNLNIPGNGTKVTFGIPSTVKFNKRIIENLPESIEKNASLHYLLNQSNRKIIYSYNGTEKVLTSAKYQFKEENLITKTNFKFLFEEKLFSCELSLYKNENKKDDGTNIIVKDKNNVVFDNTMFDFKSTLAAQNISGELVIPGLYQLCKDHLNRSVNKDAIVFDNRTGFDPRNPFYITLDKHIYPILNEVIKNQSKNDTGTNLEKNKRISDALRKINKYLKNELKDVINVPGRLQVEPPAEGIRFARNNITITKNKKYDLKLYINPSMISTDDIIEIIYESDDYLNISPLKISYSDNEIENGLVVKNVTIEGLKETSDSVKVQARVNNRISNVLIDIIEQEIHYPEKGIEFYPLAVSLVADKTHVCKLYVDTTLVPIGSVVRISANELDVDTEEIVIDGNFLLNSTIACVDVKTNGGFVGSQYEVEATCGEYNSISKIAIIEPKPNEKNSGGLIAGIQLKPYKSFFQSFIDASDRILYINSSNPINVRIIKDMDNLDPDNPKFNKEQTKYLCDILAMQCARYLVVEQAKKGDIDVEDSGLATEQILDLIQQHKNQIYVEIFPAMMGEAEEKED